MKMKFAVPFLVLAFLVAAVGFACESPFAPKSTPTYTPTLTDTPTSTSTVTLTPTATIDVIATKAAQATATAEAREAEVKAALAKIKFPVEGGSLIYYQKEPMVVDLSGYQDARYYPFLESEPVADFVLKTDVTWETNGLLVCGLMLRSDANFEQGKQYQFAFMRLSGMPAWDLEFRNYGEFQNSILGNPKTAAALDLKNGATNEIVFIAQDNKFSLYINKSFIGNYYDYSNQALDGYMAYTGWHDTGSSTCTFDHTWVWKLK